MPLIVLHHNFFIYPKLWNANISVGGGVCRGCAIYSDVKSIGAVLVRRGGRITTLYSVAFPNANLDVPTEAVWKCGDEAFSFIPGFAYHSLYQSCAPWGFPAARTQVRVKLRSIEFNADDGKKVKAEW